MLERVALGYWIVLGVVVLGALGWTVDRDIKDKARIQSLLDARTGPNIRIGDREVGWWVFDNGKAVCYMDVKTGSIGCVQLQNWKGKGT